MKALIIISLLLCSAVCWGEDWDENREYYHIINKDIIHISNFGEHKWEEHIKNQDCIHIFLSQSQINRLVREGELTIENTNPTKE